MRTLLVNAFDDSARLAPRSLQKRIGPSEVGEECSRKIAYKLLDEPKVNDSGQSWAAWLGTQAHNGMEAALKKQNEISGQLLWLVENRVPVRPGLDGSTDAYYVPWGDVVDHKFVGKTTMDEVRQRMRTAGHEDGPGNKYRVQAHLYGLGWRNMGLPVNNVHIAFYPRTSHEIKGLYVWTEAFNPDIAHRALGRLDTILAVATDLAVDEFPQNYLQIPKSPSRLCQYCPWFRPYSETGATCAGNMEKESTA